MNEGIRRPDPLWDLLFEFMHCDPEALSESEIDSDLARFGIDMDRANARLHEMTKTARARAQLKAAASLREKLQSQLLGVMAPKIRDMRENVRDVIARLANTEQQLAYFHKLESAATEDDLQSLLDDVARLRVIQELRDGQQEE